MTVYVGEANGPYVRMVAATLEELHEMADRLGVPRNWFQQPPVAHLPHYTIRPAERGRAVELGAQPVSRGVATFVSGHLALLWADQRFREGEGNTLMLAATVRRSRGAMKGLPWRRRVPPGLIRQLKHARAGLDHNALLRKLG